MEATHNVGSTYNFPIALYSNIVHEDSLEAKLTFVCLTCQQQKPCSAENIQKYGKYSMMPHIGAPVYNGNVLYADIV